MNRAEMRRAAREKQKKTATYNVTRGELEKMIEEGCSKKIAAAKEQATYDAINTAMTLLLTLPLEVLMDHYWKKSYEKRIPEFTAYVLEYYERWQNGDLDMDELKKDLWDYGGIRLEELDESEGVNDAEKTQS